MFRIEFLKRGLPHAHIVIVLAPGHRFNSIEDIDHVVSAELLIYFFALESQNNQSTH